GGIALASLMERDRPANAHSTAGGIRHFAPKAKSVIWMFMLGGVSHMESFDPKPALNRYSGLTFEESPYADQVLKSPYYRKNVRDFVGTPRDLMPKLYPLQVGYRKRGESG